MEIHEHYEDDGTKYITVEEALPVELISAALFECPSPWLRVYEFEDTGREVFGSFSIHARNGSWVYRLTRRIWWLDGVYEGRLIQGPVLRNPVVSSGHQAAVVEPAARTWPDRSGAD